MTNSSFITHYSAGISVSENEWYKMVALPGNERVIDIDIGDDGTLACVAQTGVYYFEDGQWKTLISANGVYQRVSVGDSQHVFIVDNQGQLFHYNKLNSGTNPWDHRLVDTGIEMASGASDGTLYSIERGNVLRKYVFDTKLPDPVKDNLYTVAIGNQQVVWGTISGHAFVEQDEQLDLIAGDIQQVSVGSDGTTWAVESHGLVVAYKRSLSGQHFWQQQGTPNNIGATKIAVGTAFQIVLLAADNTIYRYKPQGYEPQSYKDIKGLRDCSQACNWAYLLFPGESVWFAHADGGLALALHGTAWKIQNQYVDDITDSQGYLMYHPDKREIVLVFRGTWGTWDWYRNIIYQSQLISIPGTALHVSAAIYADWNAVKSKVVADIKQVVTILNGPENVGRFYILGHSLGAALATYAAYDLVANNLIGGIPNKEVSMVNFASPPVGDDAFASAFNKLGISVQRIINPKDIINEYSNALMYINPAWSHVGGLVPLPPGGYSPNDAHFITSYFDIINRLIRINKVSG